MNPLTALTLEQLRQRTSIKWTHYDTDVLPLWIAEMDVDLAPPVTAALGRLVSAGDTGYASPASYVEAFRGFAARRWGWDPPTADVYPIEHVIRGYVDALVAATEPGGEVVVTPPVYPPFYTYLVGAGRTMREAPLGADLRLDFAELEAAFAAATEPVSAGGPRRRAAFLLCNPHNPGGTVPTKAELERVAQLASEHGVTVVSDEIHAPLVYSGAEFTPYLTVSGGEGAALHSASKAFNLAGIPAAVLVWGGVAGPWRDAYDAVRHSWPTHFGSVAQSAAYADGDAWLDALLEGLEANRDALEGLVAEHLPGVTVARAEGTFLAWLDFRGVVDAGGPDLGDDPAAALLTDARVALNAGPTFGAGGAGHARLNFATHPDILAMAIGRLAAVVAP